MTDATVPGGNDTIVAIATAPGEAGIAIVRLSGDDSLRIADAIFHSSGPPPSAFPRHTFRHGILRGANEPGGEIDEVVLLVYRRPHSYTREDVVEIQGHGGRVCAQRILRAVLHAGARLAEPGEFTKRAFLNGRIDLLQAEAVNDLIRSHSDRSALAAIEQLTGRLSDAFTSVYDRLIEIAADMEATLNFEDNELPAAVMDGIHTRLDAVRVAVAELLATWEEGRLLREGACVVISGRPNVGKSTLLNTLLGSRRAIVTPVPGTTRDTIEEELVVEGVPVRLIDTAGLRDSDCLVEREGIARAQASMAGADLILYVMDASVPPEPLEWDALRALPRERVIVILNKTDLGNRVDERRLPVPDPVHAALLHGRGRREIVQQIVDRLGCRSAAPPHAVISERHRQIVQTVLGELAAALKCLDDEAEDQVSLAAARIRYALEELGKATGRIYTTELLDHIFGRFCIGK